MGKLLICQARVDQLETAEMESTLETSHDLYILLGPECLVTRLQPASVILQRETGREVVGR